MTEVKIEVMLMSILVLRLGRGLNVKETTVEAKAEVVFA